MTREQIGTVRITRTRIYQLDPQAPEHWHPATVIVEPGEYPLYLDGFTRYWRMTGVLNHQTARLGDGMFTMSAGDVPQRGRRGVLLAALRPGRVAGAARRVHRSQNPALVFTLAAMGTL